MLAPETRCIHALIVLLFALCGYMHRSIDDNQLAIEWIDIPIELLPENVRDPTQWKWVSFATKTKVAGTIALDFRDARRMSRGIATWFVQVSGGEEDRWAVGVRSTEPSKYLVLRMNDAKLAVFASGSLPIESSPACRTKEDQVPAFSGLWFDNHINQQTLSPGRPYSLAYLSWNGGNSYALAKLKSRHPWDNLVFFSSVGGFFDEVASRLSRLDISKWKKPVLVWTVMLASGEENLQLVED